MHPKVCKGSKEELEQKLENAHSKKDDVDEEAIKDGHYRERYIIFDFETDTSTSIHRPNHVEIDILEVDTRVSHEYDNCLKESLAFNGYGCEDKFCDWLFTKENHDTTVIAHNGAGYDNKFILKWCLSHGKRPDSFIRQGSKIAYMAFSKFKIRFVDSCNFFMCRLKDLSETFSIDTLKGHFPHYFNTEENQNYIGKIPDESKFGVREMSPKDYLEVKYLKVELPDGRKIKSCNMEFEDFLPWYRTVKQTNWNFKEDL